MSNSSDRKARCCGWAPNPDTVTLTHYAEHLAPILDKRRVRRHRRVTTPSNPQVVVDSLDDSEGIVDYPDDYFVMILTEYLQTRPARIGTGGKATSQLIDAPDDVDFAVDCMTRHF